MRYVKIPNDDYRFCKTFDVSQKVHIPRLGSVLKSFKSLLFACVRLIHNYQVKRREVQSYRSTLLIMSIKVVFYRNGRYSRKNCCSTVTFSAFAAVVVLMIIQISECLLQSDQPLIVSFDLIKTQNIWLKLFDKSLDCTFLNDCV